MLLGSLRKSAIAAIVFYLCFACSVEPHHRFPTMLPLVEQGTILDLDWESDGTLYMLTADTQSYDTSTVLYRMRPGALPSKVETDSGCAFSTISVNPNGRHGLAANCSNQHRFYVFDGGGMVTDSGSLPSDTKAVWPISGNEVWLEMHTALLCDAVAALVNGKVAPFPRILSGEQLGWRLDEGFFSKGECERRGRVLWLTPDPNRGRLLFFISQEAIGKGGVERGNVTWDLYEFNLTTGTLNALARGFDPIDLYVDPANGRAIVSGDADGKCGLWAVDAGQRKISKIASGCYSSIALSPDRSQIAAVVTEDKRDSVVSIPYSR